MACALVACLGSMAGCSGQSQEASDAAWLERYRGMSFDGDVPKAQPLPADEADDTSDDAAAAPDAARPKDEALAQFGIIDGESDWVLRGFAKDGAIHVSDDLPELVRRSVIVHELSHILDERHPATEAIRDDQLFGGWAVQEGIAREAEWAFEDETWPVATTIPTDTAPPDEPPVTLERRPIPITDFYLSARYTLGAEVARLLRRTGGASAMNNARSDPPGGYGLGLLQPERYFRGSPAPPVTPDGIFGTELTLEATRIGGLEWYLIVATQYDPVTAMEFVASLDAADSRSFHDQAGRFCTTAALLPRADLAPTDRRAFVTVLTVIAERAGAAYRRNLSAWETFTVCGDGLPDVATTTADLLTPILDRYWLIDIGVDMASIRGVAADRLCVAATAAATIPPRHADLWTDRAVYDRFVAAIDKPCRR